MSRPKMTDKQKEDRRAWRERARYLIGCTKLNHNDEEYMHVSDLVELLYEVPEYDMSESDKKKFLNELGIKE